MPYWFQENLFNEKGKCLEKLIIISGKKNIRPMKHLINDTETVTKFIDENNRQGQTNQTRQQG